MILVEKNMIAPVKVTVVREARLEMGKPRCYWNDVYSVGSRSARGSRPNGTPRQNTVARVIQVQEEASEEVVAATVKNIMNGTLHTSGYCIRGPLKQRMY